MKRFMAIGLALTIISTSVVSLAESNISYKPEKYTAVSSSNYAKVGLNYNGNSFSNISSILYEGRTLVPLRFLAENMGFKVEWNDSENSITVSSSTKTVELWIDKNDVTVNGIPSILNYGVSPKLIDGNTMLPLRYMAEIFDAEVEWDEDSFSSNVYYPSKKEVVEEAIVKGKQQILKKTNVVFNNTDFNKYFPSVVYNGKSFVSLRSMSEATGTDLKWNGNDNSITINTKDKELYFMLNSGTVLVNGIEKNMGLESAPILMTKPGEEFSSTMVPLRFIVEELGYQLEWDNESWSSNIKFYENEGINLTNINFNEKPNGIENLVLSLDGISSPKVDVSNDLMTITIPNTSVNINGLNSFNETPNSFPINFVTAEEVDGTTIVKIGFDNSVKMKKYFDGNNLVIGFELPINSIQYTDYDTNYNELVDLQFSRNPITDKYKNSPVYVKKSDVRVTGINVGTVIPKTIDLKASNYPASHTYGVLAANTVLNLKATVGDYYEITYTNGWRWATRDDIYNSMSFGTLEPGSLSSFKFLDLSKPAGLSTDMINSKILINKGILTGKGAAFAEGSKTYGVNEIYLMSHSMLETGNGTSQLANGVVVSEVNGKPVAPKKVYNMFGIGAYDATALKSGSERAYNEGWDTPEKAIIGGAKFVSENYINRPGNNQNTLYEMKWNPMKTYVWHQYATDIDWANKQVSNIKKYYDLVSNYTLYYDIPRYK